MRCTILSLDARLGHHEPEKQDLPNMRGMTPWMSVPEQGHYHVNMRSALVFEGADDGIPNAPSEGAYAPPRWYGFAHVCAHTNFLHGQRIALCMRVGGGRGEWVSQCIAL